MNREERIRRAMEIHEAGGNCAQAVAGAFADLTGSGEEWLFRAMEGFGLGMGCMEATCGAVSGGVAVVGLVNSSGSLVRISKQDTYRLAARIGRRFREQNGSLICRELKGVDSGKPLRACDDCIRDSVIMTADVLGLPQQDDRRTI